MAEQAMAFCTEHSLAAWYGVNWAYWGWALAHHGQVEEGIAQIGKGLTYMDAMENKLHLPEYFGLLAEVLGRTGQAQQAIDLLDEALATAETSGDRFYDSELYRLKGDVRHRQGADRVEVEAHYLRALAVARQQEAKSSELRAALRLSKLWQQQEKRNQALALLHPIYEWFTEGFDTADLIEAKALLEELS
jgi:predicted ATPase